MMNTRMYLSLFLLPFFTASCHKKEAVSAWHTRYYFQNNKYIAALPPGQATQDTISYVVRDGNLRVFTVAFSKDEDQAPVDGGLFGQLSIEADPNTTAFSYDDAGLAVHSAYQYARGGMSLQKTARVRQGTVSGQQISATRWQLTIDITLDQKDENTGKQQLTETGIFELQP